MSTKILWKEKIYWCKNSASAQIISIYGLGKEHALEGTLNLFARKDKMKVVLDDNGVLEYIKNDIPNTPAPYAQ